MSEISKRENLKRAVVISDFCGERAGPFVTTLLLCRGLASIGYDVVCFTGFIHPKGALLQESFRAVTPLLNKGWRWHLPHRILAWQAIRHIRKREPDVVIAVGLTRLTRDLLSGLRPGQLLVWELTNANAGNKFVDTDALKLLGRARALLSPSALIDRQIRENHQFRGKIVRVPFWVEDRVRPSLSNQTERLFHFIFLGRLDRDKGIYDLIEAVRLLKSVHPEVRVLIAGPGDSAPFFRKVREDFLEDCITFGSFPARSDAFAALEKARYLVLPSHHEGYPLVLLEAARSAIPIIATSVGSIPEMFPDSSTCRLVAPHDAAALAGAMGDAMGETEAEYRTRSNAVRARFEEISDPVAVESHLAELANA